jgi:hypothetical protein
MFGAITMAMSAAAARISSSLRRLEAGGADHDRLRAARQARTVRSVPAGG